MPSAETARAPGERGCLRGAGLVLVVSLLLVCGLVGALLVAASQPGGLVLGRDAVTVSLQMHTGAARLSILYRFAGAEGMCTRQETFDLALNPLGIHREPDCVCTVPDANYRPTQRACTPLDG